MQPPQSTCGVQRNNATFKPFGVLGGPRRQESPAIVRPIFAALHDQVEFPDIKAARAALAGDGELGQRFALLSEAIRRQIAHLLNDNQYVQQRRFQHEARIRADRQRSANDHGDTGAPLSIAADQPDPTHALAAELGAQLGVTPTVVAGEAGRAATEARGAHGVADGDTIAIHPDVDPTSNAGRATIAHEVIHQAQANLPAELDAGRDAAEGEAAQLAAAAASGATIGAPTRAIDLARPAADRDAKPVGEAPKASSAIGTAASHLSEVVESAQLALALNKTFVDADVERAKAAVLALADQVHTHSGRVAGSDGRAIDRALKAAYGLANALTVGPHARPRLGTDLHKTIAALQRLLDDPRNDEPARTPRELIPVVSESLAKLHIAREHVAARILDYSSADLHGLDQAIAETTRWVTDLSGEHGTKTAARLTRAVEDQAEVVSEVAPELEAFFRQPLTDTSDEVVTAYVKALANSTRRHDRASRTVARAKALRQRQRFDQPRAVIEGNLGDVVALGELDKAAGAQARRDQRRLEQRAEALEQRALAGGKVSNIDRDLLLVDAREQSYKRHMRVLELQLRATADGLDGLDDGLLGGANRWSDDIPNMVSDLRGIAKNTVSAVRGYDERVAIIEAAADDLDESQRHRTIADGKMAALDEMTNLVIALIENGRLTERLRAAERLAKRAQTRLFIANLLATIALTLAGNLAAAAARGAAEGVWIARAGAAGADAVEIAQGAKVVGSVAGGAADLAVNTIGQKLALGDNRSWFTVLGANVISNMAAVAVAKRFVSIEHMIDDVSEAVTGWRAIAPTLSSHAKKLAAGMPELTMSMIVGAAADHAFTRAMGYETPPADQDAMVSQWMAQGAAMALGRHISAHSAMFRRLTDHLQGGARKWAHARVLAMDLDVRAAGAMRSGDLSAAHAALAQYEALLAIERAAIADQLERAHPNRRLADDTLEPSAGKAQADHSDDAEPASKARSQAKRGDGAEDEPLPRTSPDRDPNSPEGRAENAAAIARGEPGYNEVVGYVGSHSDGIALMQRLMRGDPSALAEVGFHRDGTFDPSTREWGLGKIGNKFVLIAGEHTTVDWSVVAGVTPIGHSHPIDPGRERRHDKQVLDLAKITQQGDTLNLDAALVFASPADIYVVAVAGVREHTIPLPYEHLSGTEITLASKEPSGRQPLVLILKKATYLGNSEAGTMRFSAEAVVRTADHVVWHGQIDGVFPPGQEPHLEFNVPSSRNRSAEAPGGGPNKSRSGDAPDSVNGGTEAAPRNTSDSSTAAPAITELKATPGTVQGEHGPTPAPAPAMWDAGEGAALERELRRVTIHNKQSRVAKAMKVLEASPHGPQLARVLLDPRIRAARGYDGVVQRLLAVTEKQQVELLAELADAEHLLATGDLTNSQLALGEKSQDTRRGDPGHFDLDSALVDRDGNIVHGVQTYRPSAASSDDVLHGATDKIVAQLADAPAGRKTLAVHVDATMFSELTQRATDIVEIADRHGVAIDLVGPDGTRVSYGAAAQ
ncbi:MAG: DUF4157 domain-containing protein [Myxococcales bacterium]|nr:DUF4157 domain-containing protein [Myxococcales bacterium]